MGNYFPLCQEHSNAAARASTHFNAAAQKTCSKVRSPRPAKNPGGFGDILTNTTQSTQASLLELPTSQKLKEKFWDGATPRR